MFFAEKSDNVSLTTYLELVDQLLEKKDDTYKSLIDKIIMATAEASSSNGEKLNKVDSSIYSIVSKLYNSNSSYFANIHSLLDINKTVYLDLKSILKSLSTAENTQYNILDDTTEV